MFIMCIQYSTESLFYCTNPAFDCRILINFFYLIIFFLHTIIIAQMSSTGPVLASQDPITAGTSVHQNTHRRIHPWAYPYHITYVDSAFVGQCPTWWSPCRTEVVPSVQCRKVWL